MENVWFLNHGDFTVSQYLPSSKADKNMAVLGRKCYICKADNHHNVTMDGRQDWGAKRS